MLIFHIKCYLTLKEIEMSDEQIKRYFTILSIQIKQLSERLVYFERELKETQQIMEEMIDNSK